MAFDINTFRTEGLPYGGARPSLFEIQIPNTLPLSSVSNVEDTLVRCQAATLPEFRTTTIDVYYMGRPIKVVGERVFQPWTVRVYNEIDFGLRDFFEAWSNLENTIIGNQAQLTDNILAVNGGYKLDGVIVRQLSRQLGIARSYVFFGMYPEIVGSIDLNWQDANRIETFDVQFAYDYCVPAGALNGPSGYDTTVSAPGSYDVEGTPAPSGQGSIPTFVFPGANVPTNFPNSVAVPSGTASPAFTPVS
jgi:hypothetical protein